MNAAASKLDEHWVFAYGSLLWNPGFSYVERARAVVRGYRRSLCVFSHVHRGTVAQPGLVLGLDRGGACVGAAYKVSPSDWHHTMAYLRAREQATAIYREVSTPARLEDGRRIQAVTYAVDRAHHQYAAKLTLEETVALVRQGVGRSGDNVAYVLRTHAHLLEMGIRDPVLASLSDRLARNTTARQAPLATRPASDASA